jgi:isopenicillin N synthase-like dioxygenase
MVGGHSEYRSFVWLKLYSNSVALVILICLSLGSMSLSTQSELGEKYGIPHKATIAPTTAKVVAREIVQISFQDLESVFGDGGINSDDVDGFLHNSVDINRVDNGLESQSSVLLQKIQDAFGPDGLGLLEITNIPQHMVDLRQRLLPMAAELANLSPEELRSLELPHTHYTIGWSHGRERLKGMEADDHDLAKGSFYMNPFLDDSSDGGNPNVYPPTLQPQLEECMLAMSRFMAKVGLWISQLCDLYLEQQEKLDCNVHIQYKDQRGIQPPSSPNHASTNATCTNMIYESLKGCQTAKARLLYYYPPQRGAQQSLDQYHPQHPDIFDDWCGWHTDHGSLTALLPGMLCGVNKDDDSIETTETEQSNIHTLPFVHKPGLYIQTRRPGELVHAQLSETSLGIQLGETLEIMSRGRFRATPHAVKAPPPPYNGAFGMGRSSLAVFLQPSADQSLPPLTEYNNERLDGMSTHSSLPKRWRPTFGAFQQATTAAFN